MTGDPTNSTRYPGPVIVCVRGPSRSGKTSVAAGLIEQLRLSGREATWVKRTHHLLDLPDKASGRIWARQPSAMVMSAPDRVQLTLPRGDPGVRSLLQLCPPTVDLVLLETHSPEPYPTILYESLPPALDEDVIARWKPGASFDNVAVELAPVLLALLPADRELDLALRAAMTLHGGHACAGLVLGTRLALLGARALDIPVPDVSKRLIVLAETDRCAVDAIQAVTGCRPGKRTLRILDYGKLAATFIDQRKGTAVRVATRADLRERAGTSIDSRERHGTQRAAYLAMRDEELFTVAVASSDVDQFDLPGPPRRRVNCSRCGEEVSDGREITTESGPWCRPCAVDAPNNRNDGGTA